MPQKVGDMNKCQGNWSIGEIDESREKREVGGAFEWIGSLKSPLARENGRCLHQKVSFDGVKKMKQPLRFALRRSFADPASFHTREANGLRR